MTWTKKTEILDAYSLTAVALYTLTHLPKKVRPMAIKNKSSTANGNGVSEAPPRRYSS